MKPLILELQQAYTDAKGPFVRRVLLASSGQAFVAKLPSRRELT